MGISADENPKILDTSDRERFAQNTEYDHFEAILNAVVGALENERHQDDIKEEESPLQSLFTDLIPDDDFLDLVSDAAEAGDTTRVVSLLEAHKSSTQKVVREIEKRFAYYSHLATVGAISETIIHEIRSRTALISYFIRHVPDECIEAAGETLRQAQKHATDASLSLERLAERFSPLANRRFKRGARTAFVEDRIDQCIEYHQDEIQAAKVKVVLPSNRSTEVAVDPAELEAILLNLTTNALYWVQQRKRRIIEFELRRNARKGVVTISVHDSGNGIPKGDEGQIFLPGVTRKPNGIGMGLTVAGELVSAYGSKLRVEANGKHKGASFSFDLPLAK